MIHKIIRSLHIYKNWEEYYQLALIGLWEARERYHPGKGSFTNYAYTYMKGTLLKEMTRSSREQERTVYPEEEFWDLIKDPAAVGAGHSFETRFLLAHCGGLTDNQVKWLLYTCLSDLSIKEIAEREQVSVSAVKAWRKGAREKLRMTLEVVE